MNQTYNCCLFLSNMWIWVILMWVDIFWTTTGLNSPCFSYPSCVCASLKLQWVWSKSVGNDMSWQNQVMLGQQISLAGNCTFHLSIWYFFSSPQISQSTIWWVDGDWNFRLLPKKMRKTLSGNTCHSQLFRTASDGRNLVAFSNWWCWFGALFLTIQYRMSGFDIREA